MNKKYLIITTLYIILLLTCVALMVSAEFFGPSFRESVLPVATDSFKVVLGAIIGALATMLCNGEKQ